MRRHATRIVLGLADAAALGLDACSGDNATNTTASSAASSGAASGNGASNSSMTANPGAPQDSGAAPAPASRRADRFN
jgi:hypothetical protein